MNEADVLEIPREERRRDYELTAVLSASSNENVRSAVVDMLRRLISDEQGELIEVSASRHVALSYPVRHERQGYIATLTFRGGSHLPKRLADAVRHDKSLLRLLIAERAKPPRRRASHMAPQEPHPVSPEDLTPSEEKRMDEQIEAALVNERLATSD